MEQPQVRGLSDWRPLAHGGLADLWEARQLSLDRRVAVKIYGPSRDEADRGFLKEVAAASRLSSHPGIVTVYDAGILPDDRLYLIMEFCPGGSLNTRLDAQNRLSDDRVRWVGVQIADALAAAHSAGILHRGVTPAKILIDSYGNARLTDFGLAAVVGAGIEGADAPPAPSAYTPPEAFDETPTTEFGDVFSLGATLVALLTGQAPPRVAATTVGKDRGSEGGTGPLSAVDPSLVTALMRGLAIDPRERPTAARFRDQLLELSFVRESADRSTNDVTPGMATASRAESAETSSSTGSGAVAAGAAARGSTGEIAAVTRPGWGRRPAGIPALAAAAFAVIASAGIWLISDSATDRAAPEIPTATVESVRVADPGPSTPATTGPDGTRTAATPGAAERGITLVESPLSTKPFQVTRIRGMYAGGADTFLRAQRQENGKWISFPLPAKTDQSGRFTLYVELDKAGRYQLRALDPASGITSDPLVLEVNE